VNPVLLAFWFFTPAGLANAAPVFANKFLGYNRWKTPLDFGLSWRGKRLFGENKTFRGLVAGIVLATLAVGLQKYLFGHSGWIQEISLIDYSQPAVWLLGPLFGAGALLGDAVESFFKRQAGIPSGQSWFPFDQIDYIIGGLLLSLPLVRLQALYYLWILVVWFSMHLIVSYIGYLLHLKDRPI